jgi:hypothetical protein
VPNVLRSTTPCRSDRGQASLEWLALITLVATLLGGLGAAMAQAEFLGRRVTRAMARAICLVGNGDCRRDQEPCAVTRRAASGSVTLDLAILRLGTDRYGLVERRSDGTFAVTVEDGMSAGLEAALGLSVGARVGSVGGAIGGDVAAALLARHGHGRTWIAGSAAEAERLLATQGDGRPPDVVSGSGAWRASVSTGVSGTVGDKTLALASAGLGSDRAAGWSTDRRTGHRTAYIQASETARAALGPDGVLGAASASHGGEVYAVEFDASGRPVDLRVTASGVYDVSRDLPAVVQPVEQLLAATGADRTYEVTTHLDLTDPDNLAAARGLLTAITDRRATATTSAATAAVRARIEQRGTVEARVLRTTRAASSSADLHVTFEGFSFGGQTVVAQRSEHLLTATSRGLDGLWIVRSDCLA